MMRLLWRWLVVLLEWLAALVILFEEWGWEPLQRLMQRLAQWPLVATVEAHIGALSPIPALLVFALPSLLLLPVNLFGLWLTAQGQAGFGSAVIVAAKLLSTTLVARIFTLTRPALLQLSWFARLYARWQVIEAKLLAMVRQSWVWQLAGIARRRLADWRRQFLATTFFTRLRTTAHRLRAWRLRFRA